MHFVKNFKITCLYFLVTIIFFSSSYWLQFHTEFLPAWDSYYHVKMAKIIKILGVIHKFPWLQYTILNKNYVDSHFLFHIFLIPFLKLGIFFGPKLAIVIIQTLIFLIFFTIIRAEKIPYPFFWISTIFILPSDFFYRINLIRVSGLSLLLLLLGIYFLFKNKNILLAILLYFYTLSYIGFFIFLPILFLYIFFQSREEHKFIYKPLFSSFLGIGLGLISHPYFPQIFKYLYINIIKSGIAPQIPVGSEWYPYHIYYFINISFFTLILYLIAIVRFIIIRKKLRAKEKTIFYTTLFLFLLTISCRRFIEYWPIFALLTFLMITKDYLQKLWAKLKYKEVKIGFLGLCFFYLLILGEKNLSEVRKSIMPAVNIYNTKDAIFYIKNHSQRGDIVFTDDWDIFTYYFFFNTKNYYTIGLDPSFMYVYNQDLYKKFVCLTQGSRNLRIKGIYIDAQKYGRLESIKNDFKAKWVIVDNQHKDFFQNLIKHPLFQLVYQNEDYYVFRVKY